MQVKVPTARIARTRVQQVKVAEIKVGTVEIDRLTLNNLRVDTSTGKATLHKVRLDLTMTYLLDWRFGLTVDAPWPLPDFDVSESGKLNLGSMQLGIDFPDLEVPGLADLSFDVASLPVTGVTAVIGALRNLDLGGVLAEQIRAQNLTTPRRGFSLAGLALGGTRMSGVQVPDVRATSASVERVSGGTVPIANVSVPNIGLGPVSIPNLSSNGVDASTQPVECDLPKVDVGLLAAQLTVKTSARLRVQELRLENVQASADIGEIALENLQLPFEVLGVTLAGIQLDGLDVPQLEVN
jgi:hypothetical protein